MCLSVDCDHTLRFAPIIDRPFAPPIDTILDIPVPPSINRTRKINKAALGELDRWKANADVLLMASGQYRQAKRFPVGDRFEIQITVDETQCRKDLDNICKAAIDYLKRLELIKDDGPQYLRRVVLEWGEAPAGCRVMLRASA